MKNTLLKSFVLALSMAALTACDRGTIDSNLIAKDSSGNNNIYRDYNVDYNEVTNASMATATFSLGSSWGTTVRLVPPASLTINGLSPKENTDKFDGGEVAAFYAGFLFPPAWLFAGATGTTYHQTISGNPGNISFEFIDNSGSYFHETAHIPTLSLNVPPTTSSSGFNIDVLGNSLGGNTSVRLSQGDNYKSVSGYGSQIRILSTDLSAFAPGNIQVHVEVSLSTHEP